MTWQTQIQMRMAALVKSGELPPSRAFVLTRLMLYANYRNGRNARPGIAQLALDLSVSHSTVTRALSDGRRLGLIVQTKQGGSFCDYKIASTYDFVVPPLPRATSVHPSEPSSPQVRFIEIPDGAGKAGSSGADAGGTHVTRDQLPRRRRHIDIAKGYARLWPRSLEISEQDTRRLDRRARKAYRVQTHWLSDEEAKAQNEEEPQERRTAARNPAAASVRIVDLLSALPGERQFSWIRKCCRWLVQSRRLRRRRR